MRMSRILLSILELDRTVHEPARLAILGMLSIVEEADFLFLLKETGLTRGNLSSHMSKLESRGYITVSKGYSGRTPRTALAITPEGRKALGNYKAKMGTILKGL